eukprot:TRINITY_DN5862_c0_g3_i7.p1 TRINITY_DN5862_c0_g3~~TRINITY_DN5862_c0_g3_i7.p1  ORF type:complete len:324 (-),score=71.37 TRINITY_DN5862_c0_g3_i7:125-1096(-)
MTDLDDQEVESLPLYGKAKDETNGEAYMLGIDEAGRGPVLGPMVYGVSWCPVAMKDDLKKLKVADSKQLTEEDRERIFKRIRGAPFVGFKVDVISPEELSAKMLKISKYNLNLISHDSAINLVKDVIKSGVHLTEVYVDTVGDPGRYQEKLEGIFPGVAITVAKKADSLYPVVSAASICAKVIRDHHLKYFRFREKFSTTFKRNFGSGYPGDPATKLWLRAHCDPVFGFPTIIRFSWKTSSVYLADNAHDISWHEEEVEEAKALRAKLGEAKTTQAVRRAEAALDAQDKKSKRKAPERKQRRRRHRYFSSRLITVMNKGFQDW